MKVSWCFFHQEERRKPVHSKRPNKCKLCRLCVINMLSEREKNEILLSFKAHFVLSWTLTMILCTLLHKKVASVSWIIQGLLFKILKKVYWRVVVLQCCVNFFRTSERLIYTYICMYNLYILFHTVSIIFRHRILTADSCIYSIGPLFLSFVLCVIVCIY